MTIINIYEALSACRVNLVRIKMTRIITSIALFYAILLVSLSCGRNNDSERYITDKQLVDELASGAGQTYWYALGDSDFDSYQADDRPYRVNVNGYNAENVLSPIEVQSKNGMNFGAMSYWGGIRRLDYRHNYSLSGATVRGNLYNWRQYLEEDILTGIKAFMRETRDIFTNENNNLANAFLAGLVEKRTNHVPDEVPVIVQISIGINDINNELSSYKSSTTPYNDYSWIDKRTQTIGRIVDDIRRLYPDYIIVLWQILDESRWEIMATPEEEALYTDVTAHWNNNLQIIAEDREGVIVFKADSLTEKWIGRKSANTDHDIIIDGIRYMRDMVPDSSGPRKADNTGYVATIDGHGNTVLSALYTREIYRLLNDRYGMGIAPLTDVKINAITGQSRIPTRHAPTLTLPADVIIERKDLPYNLGHIIAHDSNGKDISDSAVAVSNTGGVLFGDGQNLRLRPERHSVGTHVVTVRVTDANNKVTSGTMRITIR